MMITRALDDRPLPVYGDGRNIRDWLHVADHASAIWTVCTRADDDDDETYNIGARSPVANIELVRLLLRELGKPESLISFVDDRPGHDRRYEMDAGRITARLGWAPRVSLEAGFRETVRWYVENEAWWRPRVALPPRAAPSVV